MKNKFALQPDAYTRFATARYLVEQIARQKKQEHYKILDIGGSSNFLYDFLKETDLSFEMTIVDPLPAPKALPKSIRYIQAGGETVIDMREDFDIVTMIDVLEHIPGDILKRDIVSSAAKVARLGLIIAGPYSTPLTDEYEHELNEINKKLFGVDQNWLAEHFEFGKPDIQETMRSIFKVRKDFIIKNAYTLPFPFWLQSSMANLIPHASYFLKESSITSLNKEFNMHYQQRIDSMFTPKGYRGYIVASKKEVMLQVSVKSFEEYSRAYLRQYTGLVTMSAKSLEKANAEIADLNMKLREISDRDTLAVRAKQLNEEVKYLQAEIKKRDEKIKRITSLFPLNLAAAIFRKTRRYRQ